MMSGPFTLQGSKHPPLHSMAEKGKYSTVKAAKALWPYLIDGIINRFGPLRPLWGNTWSDEPSLRSHHEDPLHSNVFMCNLENET